VADKVYEDWIDIDLQLLPEPFSSKRILALHFQDLGSFKEVKLFALFEQGIIASFILPFRPIKSKLEASKPQFNQTTTNLTNQTLQQKPSAS